MYWMFLPLRRYFEFSGRSRRQEYWLFTLFNVLLSVAFSIAQAAVGGGAAALFARDDALIASPSDGAAVGASIALGLQALVSLALLIPRISVTVRRLHDTDRSGWWVLAPLIPAAVMIAGGIYFVTQMFAGGQNPDDMLGLYIIIGVAALALVVLSLVLFVFMCLDGTRGPNRFGPDPKGDSEVLDDVFR